MIVCLSISPRLKIIHRNTCTLRENECCFEETMCAGLYSQPSCGWVCGTTLCLWIIARRISGDSVQLTHGLAVWNIIYLNTYICIFIYVCIASNIHRRIYIIYRICIHVYIEIVIRQKRILSRFFIALRRFPENVQTRLRELVQSSPSVSCSFVER